MTLNIVIMPKSPKIGRLGGLLCVKVPLVLRDQDGIFEALLAMLPHNHSELLIGGCPTRPRGVSSGGCPCGRWGWLLREALRLPNPNPNPNWRF